MEYVALSRDTTETDLKQRREIRSGTAFYIDKASRALHLSLVYKSDFAVCKNMVGYSKLFSRPPVALRTTGL